MQPCTLCPHAESFSGPNIPKTKRPIGPKGLGASRRPSLLLRALFPAESNESIEISE
jgi:hypothetical protein